MAQIIDASYEILSPIDGEAIIRHLEKIARTCYKSEDKITSDGVSARNILNMLIKSGHDAMIEHHSISVRFICDLGFYKDLTRHRMASYAIESTRYCNYSKGKFGEQLTLIKPCHIAEGTEEYKIWLECMNDIERHYMAMAALVNEDGKPKCKPDQLRMMLPHSTKAEVNITANLREWRHIMKLRTAPVTHPTITNLLRPLLDEFKARIPVIFDDITY
jgi:thymidylate synthase (FAD)